MAEKASKADGFLVAGSLSVAIGVFGLAGIWWALVVLGSEILISGALQARAE